MCCVSIQKNRDDSLYQTALDKFKGFLPAITDWHARVCFFRCKCYYYKFSILKFYICVFRSSGKDFILASLQVTIPVKDFDKS